MAGHRGEGVVAPRPAPSPPPPGRELLRRCEMQRSLSRHLRARAGATVRLEGWVHRRRELAKVSFLIVRDRTGLAQVVLPAGRELPGEETVVEVTGRAVANPVAPGGVEVVEP